MKKLLAILVFNMSAAQAGAPYAHDTLSVLNLAPALWKRDIDIIKHNLNRIRALHVNSSDLKVSSPNHIEKGDGYHGNVAIMEQDYRPAKWNVHAHTYNTLDQPCWAVGQDRVPVSTGYCDNVPVSYGVIFINTRGDSDMTTRLNRLHSAMKGMAMFLGMKETECGTPSVTVPATCKEVPLTLQPYDIELLDNTLNM